MLSHLQLSYIAVSSFLPCHEPWTRGNDLVMAWDRILIGFRNLDNTTWTMIYACIQKLIPCRKSTSYDTTGKIYTWNNFSVVILSCHLWVGITCCQSRLDLAGVKLLQICIFAFGHDVHTFIGAMRRGYHVGWSFQHSIIHMDFRVRGWQVSLVLLVLHNFLVSALKDMQRH